MLAQEAGRPWRMRCGHCKADNTSAILAGLNALRCSACRRPSIDWRAREWRLACGCCGALFGAATCGRLAEIVAPGTTDRLAARHDYPWLSVLLQRVRDG